MLSHCKNNAIHCKINDICIAWTLIHCKNNAIHHKSNDICIVWMLSHCKNNAIHCKINDICIAWTLTLCKNNAILCKSNDICIVWMLAVPFCIPMLTVFCCHTIVIPVVIPLSYPGRRFGVCVGFANSVWLS